MSENYWPSLSSSPALSDEEIAALRAERKRRREGYKELRVKTSQHDEPQFGPSLGDSSLTHHPWSADANENEKLPTDSGKAQDPEVARLREQLAAAEHIAELRAELEVAQTDLRDLQDHITLLNEQIDIATKEKEVTVSPQKEPEDDDKSFGRQE